MILNSSDWAIIIAFFAVSVMIGVLVSRKAGKSYSEFFLSGRNMPWWLLGVSMVATTFSCDTPNLVTDIVRQHGVAGNWAWWAFLLTGMLTVSFMPSSGVAPASLPTWNSMRYDIAEKWPLLSVVSVLFTLVFSLI